jgi:hypothetical protein
MSNYSKDEAIKELQKKLEIEKAKFNKFVEDLKDELLKISINFGQSISINRIIDELSSKEMKAKDFRKKIEESNLLGFQFKDELSSKQEESNG